MPNYITTCCLLLVCIGTGCDTTPFLTVTQPIGEPVSAVELEKLRGSWIADDPESERLDHEILEGVTMVRVSKAGDLFAGGCFWNEDTERFEAVNLKLVATRFGTNSYLYMKLDPSEDRYFFVRYEVGKDKAIRMFLPIEKHFKQAVESGTLKGTVGPNLIISMVNLEASSDALQAFVVKAGVDKCFEKEPFITLTRGKRNR